MKLRPKTFLLLLSCWSTFSAVLPATDEIQLARTTSPLKRDFSRLIANVATRQSLRLTPLTNEWVFLLEKGDKKHTIFYYDFDVNGAGSYQGCKDKVTTVALLKRGGIPSVDHELFVTPAEPKYAPKTGVWPSIEAYAKQFNYKVVCKPANGSGGEGVEKASTLLELEALYVKNLGAGQYDFYISPAVDIRDEYRVIMLGQEPQLIYRKVRPELLGDGIKTVRDLFLDYVGRLPSKKAFNGFFTDFPGISLDLEYILPSGGRYALKWKHNLEQGGVADTNIEPDICKKLVGLAQRSMEAVNVGFASVDIVDIRDGEWKVLEINAGVMMKHFMGQNGKEGEEVAEAIYERAICKMFDLEPSSEAQRMYTGSLTKILERDKVRVW